MTTFNKNQCSDVRNAVKRYLNTYRAAGSVGMF